MEKPGGKSPPSKEVEVSEKVSELFKPGVSDMQSRGAPCSMEICCRITNSMAFGPKQVARG